MILTFDKEKVKRLYDHSRVSRNHMTAYDGKQYPGLALVSDHGIYLMSTGRPGLRQDGTAGELKEGERFFVVYAHEVDPTAMLFEEWWENKIAAFGDDDGVEYLRMDEVRRWLSDAKGDAVRIDFGEEEYHLLS